MNIFLMTSVPMNPPWDQGDKNLAYALAGALPQHRFRVLTARSEPLPQGDNLVIDPAYRSRYPSLGEKAGVYWRLLSQSTRPRGTQTTSGSAAASPPDLYHLAYQPYPLSSRLGRLLPAFRHRPTLQTVPAAASGRRLTRDLFFADRVVAMSEYGQRALRDLGVANVVHIRPGIPTARWQALHGLGAKAKAHLGLDGRPIVLFPGHYGPGQGSDVLLRALPQLADQVPGVCVVLACRLRSFSDREREVAFHQAVERMGLAGSVRRYNIVPDMGTLIAASDVVALPLETMRDKVDIPTTLLEALATARPVIISDLPPMNELVAGTADPGASPKVGLVVPRGDGDALAGAAASLLLDHRRREQLGLQGQALVRTHYDIHHVARQYEQLYQEMVQ